MTREKEKTKEIEGKEASAYSDELLDLALMGGHSEGAELSETIFILRSG